MTLRAGTHVTWVWAEDRCSAETAEVDAETEVEVEAEGAEVCRRCRLSLLHSRYVRGGRGRGVLRVSSLCASPSVCERLCEAEAEAEAEDVVGLSAN